MTTQPEGSETRSLRPVGEAFGGREVADRWDAGEMGCGELVIQLRRRLGVLAPGSLFELVARDPGAPEDLPAWCRLTRHGLVASEHPHYLIKRRMET